MVRRLRSLALSRVASTPSKATHSTDCCPTRGPRCGAAGFPLVFLFDCLSSHYPPPPYTHTHAQATIATNRDYWYRAGFDDRELVAAMGGHTLGGTQTPARDFTSTPDIFNNEYYSSLLAHESTAGNPPCCVATAGGGLAQLPTDRALLSDPATRSLVQLYAANQSLFFHDYARAVRKMSLFGRDSSVQWCLYPAATVAGAGTGAGAVDGAADADATADATGATATATANVTANVTATDASIAVAVAATDAAVPAVSVSATAPQPQPQPQPPLL